MDAIHETELVGLLEALYAVERTDDEWLSGAVTALAELCGGEHHYIGFFYDASNVRDFKLYKPCARNVDPEIQASFELFRTLPNPDFVRATFRSLYIGSARRTAPTHLQPLLEQRRKAGWGDILNINGLDPSGIGCLLTIGGREPEFVLDANQAAVFRRIANHLGAAFRCRRKLAELDRGECSGARSTDVSRGAEAILDAQGRFVHARGAAESPSARERIKASVLAIDSIRAPKERSRGQQALQSWHPLTGARWTIVDRYEENGRRFIVARENQMDTVGLDLLTDRERQVVVHAALGLSTKQIAYTLGISEVTVRVLTARAARRLGVRTKKALLGHPALQSLGAAEAAPNGADGDTG